MGKKLFIEDNIGFAELVEVFGDDLMIVNAARVSFNKESAMDTVRDQEGSVIKYELPDRDAKLINYLAKHNHITPFFHPMLQFRLKMPIFVAREWFRHVIGFARNEVSRRYVSTGAECFVPATLRKRDKNVKQGSSLDAIDNNDAMIKEMHEYNKKSIEYYNRLMEQDDVCPEQARMVLPQSMYTEFIETGSLAAYARLVKLRDEATAQQEIQIYAKFISNLVEEHFPVAWKALVGAHASGTVEKSVVERKQNEHTA